MRGCGTRRGLLVFGALSAIWAGGMVAGIIGLGIALRNGVLE